jgi:quinol monooxygenase YgiN
MSGFIRASASLLLGAMATSASAQTPAPTLTPTARVAFLEVAPSEVQRTVNLLKTYRQTVQKAPGISHIEVLQQVGRPNLFAVHEKWSDSGTLQAHLASADSRKFRENVQGALLAPIDERLLAPIAVTPASGVVSDRSIYVLTHADAAARREEIPGMLQALATGARRENGNLLFDATVQPNRTNHFTLIEVWADQKAYESHVTTERTRNFRADFAAVSGALYDERIYKPIR